MFEYRSGKAGRISILSVPANLLEINAAAEDVQCASNGEVQSAALFKYFQVAHGAYTSRVCNRKPVPLSEHFRKRTFNAARFALRVNSVYEKFRSVFSKSIHSLWGQLYIRKFLPAVGNYIVAVPASAAGKVKDKPFLSRSR